MEKFKLEQLDAEGKATDCGRNYRTFSTWAELDEYLTECAKEMGDVSCYQKHYLRVTICGYVHKWRFDLHSINSFQETGVKKIDSFMNFILSSSIFKDAAKAQNEN